MIDEESQSSSLYDAVRAAIDERLLEVWTCAPARVETYDATKQKAKVTILVKEVHEDEDGVRRVETVPIVHEVPVKTNGAGGYHTSYPVQPGDVGVVWVCTQSIDVWAQQGGIVDPLDDRRFDVNDAIFEPGLRDFKHALTGLPTDRARFGRDGGGPALEVRATDVLVGGGVLPHESTLLATTYLAAFSTLVAAIATAVGGIPGGGAAGTAITSALATFNAAAPTFTSVLAKVR